MSTQLEERAASGATAPPAGPPRGRWFAVTASVVTLVAVVAFLAFVTPGDVTVELGPSTTGTASPTTAVPTTEEPVDRRRAIWPVAGSATQFTDPVGVAGDFATTFLGFSDPIVGPLHEGDARSGEVEVRPIANGPVTTVVVRRLGREGTWSVLAASTGHIELTSPRPLDRISSPVSVTGRARAVEGTVQVEVREDGELGAIGAGSVAGGDVMTAFEEQIPFETPATPFGTLVLFTTSADNGQVWEAVALRVRLTSTDASEDRRP